jgi:hypothetical protein
MKYSLEDMRKCFIAGMAWADEDNLSAVGFTEFIELLNSDQNPERSVATEDDSSTKAD